MSDYIQAYGSHALASLAIQPRMEYFHVPGRGYIPYARQWGREFVLADPLCDPFHAPSVLQAFLSRYPQAGFLQISPPIAEILHRRHDYYATQFGAEALIDLPSWNLTGKKKQTLRTALNRARAEGIEIAEESYASGAEAISARWFSTRRCRRPLGFLTRTTESAPGAAGARYFYARQHGEILGFVFFDPIYRRGHVIGYVPNRSCSATSFRQGLWYAMMCHALAVFQSEEVEYVNLGLMPMFLSQACQPQESKPVHQLVRAVYQYGGCIYNFQGLAFAKSRFEGRVVPAYCGHRGVFPAFSMLAMLRLIGMI